MAMARLTAILGRSEPDTPSNGEPAGIRISRETISGETVLNVVVTAPRYKPWFSGVVIGVPAILMLVSLADSNYWFISLFCLAWVLPALLVVVPDLRTPREIDITRKFITFSDAVAGSGGSSETIPVPSVRAIESLALERLEASLDRVEKLLAKK